jgi:hypothetical protein
MNRLTMVIGLVVVALGVVAIATPDNLVTIGRDVATPTGLYVVAVLRVCIGLAFIFAAPTSRMPRTVRIVGGIVVIAGIVTPMFGVDRSLAVVNWLAAQGPLLIRLAAVWIVALGSFMIYATGSVRRAA